MVMKWLGGGKVDHPLAEEKGAKEVLASLAQGEAGHAIEEIRHWVESVTTTEGFKTERRGELLLQLDEAAQPHQQKLSREYFAGPALSKFQEARLWGALAGLSTDLGAGYAAVIGQIAADAGSAGRLKPQLPLLAVRAVRALSAQLKWHYLHYEPGGAAWALLGSVYGFAEAKKIHRESVPLYPRAPLASSAEREFTKALMLAASSPDCLMPLEIDLAERIVTHLGAGFVIATAHQPQSTHNWIDLASGAPPKRLTQTPPPSAGLRFFSAGPADAKLDAMIKVAESGAVPSDLSLGTACEPARLLAVLRHLKTYWSATPPVRKHDRYEVKHRLSVVNGFAGVLARLKEGANGSADTWVTENISAGGIGAVAGKMQSDWLGIGRLVGLSVEGGSSALSVGMVRRCSRLPDKQSSVGVRTFAKESFAIALEGGGEFDALLLNDGRALKDEVFICMREGTFDKRASPTIAFDGRNYLLMPLAVSETGVDFEVVRYRVMQQS